VEIPGLTLQPVVENGVRHGISHRLEGGAIRVDLNISGGECRIDVWNQYDSAGESLRLEAGTIFQPGHALANIRERLQLAYGERAGVELSVFSPDWVKATVTIPMNGARHARPGDR
jgi:two-component system LytT family sensor kinase